MSKQPVICNKGCGQQIGFSKLESGKWKPTNLDGTDHDCQKKFAPKEGTEKRDYSSYSGIKEIAEVHGTDRIQDVNEYLKNGWTIIKTVSLLNSTPGEEIIYVLGRRA